MKRPHLIVFWYLIFVLSFYFAVFFIMGKRALLQRATIIRPYAEFYLTTDWIGDAEKSADKLVFFFGDSTLLGGRDKQGRGAAEMVGAELKARHPELGQVSVVNKAFGSATLFHFYCLMFRAEKYSPDLLIIPLNWYWFGAETDYWSGKQHLRQMASMVPIREYFSPENGNPLELAGVSLADRILYSLDMYLLCGAGLKVWISERFDLPMMLKRPAKPQWLPLGSAGFRSVLCPSHPSVDLLRYIANTANDRDLRVLFYIAPMPYEKVQQWEKHDPDLFECSIQRLLNASTTRNTRCINLVKLLSVDQFTDGLHYNFSGHVDITEALVPQVHMELSAEAE